MMVFAKNLGMWLSQSMLSISFLGAAITRCSNPRKVIHTPLGRTHQAHRSSTETRPELGTDEEQLHQQVGEYAVKSGIDALFTLGNLSAFASAAFKGQHFEDLDLLKIALLEEGKSSDLTMLVKGSRSSQMDLVVDMLLAEKS